MIRHPLGLRLDAGRSIRDQIHEAARLGARGIVLDAIGEVKPPRLGETGRRELRHLLRTVELGLVALSLPTRRPFDTTDELENRIRRADSAFALAYELGTNLVLVRAGQVPPEDETERFEVFKSAISSLASRAEHRGIRLVLETGTESGSQLRGFLDSVGDPSLAASIDPASLLRAGIDPIACVRELDRWVGHAYAPLPSRAASAGPNSRGFGMHPGTLGWEEYLGSLEEVGYAGYLTVWPDSAGASADQFTAVVKRLGALA
jgi:sugar phosphate isomerase/epimerase